VKGCFNFRIAEGDSTSSGYWLLNSGFLAFAFLLLPFI
jgi:hypothetical protein